MPCYDGALRLGMELHHAELVFFKSSRQAFLAVTGNTGLALIPNYLFMLQKYILSL